MSNTSTDFDTYEQSLTPCIYEKLRSLCPTLVELSYKPQTLRIGNTLSVVLVVTLGTAAPLADALPL